MILLRRPMSNRACAGRRCRVPPSPELMASLLERYNELVEEGRVPKDLTFQQFFEVWATRRRGLDLPGLDDGRTHAGPQTAAALISRPPKKLAGVVRTIALLVDFSDQAHTAPHSNQHYKRMLFGLGNEFPTGSMRDYYRGISNFNKAARTGIDIQGEVFGWFRLPHPMAFYANANSGMSSTFPRNAQGMARDAIRAALDAGVDFKGYDALGEGTVTALFIIHAGRGAEETGDPEDLWSHKWIVPTSPRVAPKLKVSSYLTVPEDCRVGVCAHEWGHLAARWADFYDTGSNENTNSNGLGDFCLMASGSWTHGGNTPSLPNGMLRMFHSWIKPRVVTKTTKGLVLRPAAEGGDCIVIQNKKAMKPSQYVLVEYRRRQFQDAFLPDEGIAVYVIDESIKDVNDEDQLAIELMQADGKRDLAAIFGAGNRGDSGDLYPHKKKALLNKSSKPPLDLPSGKWTGVSIKVKGTPGASSMSIDVTLGP